MSTTVTHRPRALAKLGLTGILAGALVSVVGGCHWLLLEHAEDDFEFCDDAYDDCLGWAISAEDRSWCEEDVKACYEACEGGWEEDEAGDDETGDPGGGNTSNETAEGDGDEGDGDEGDGDEGDDEGGVCIDLFGNCIDDAETLSDVDACEALYDHCVHPGECPLPECGGCPAEELEACLDQFSECTALADTPEKVEVCGASFDECTAPFAEECAVEAHPNLEPCLEQHELCVACAEDDLQVAACQDVFATCMMG
jgi:hypothetical protein